MRVFRASLALVTIFLLLIAPSVSAESTETTTLSQYAGVFKEASEDSQLLGALPPDTAVELLSLSGGWARVRYKLKTGYVRMSALSLGGADVEAVQWVVMRGRTLYVARPWGDPDTPRALVLTENDPVTYLSGKGDRARILYKGRYAVVPLTILAADEELCYPFGASGDSIAPLQARLEDLGYYDGDATGVFDLETNMALIRFRMRIGLSGEFVVDDTTHERLYREDAPQSLIRRSAFRVGDAGDGVDRVQRRLIALGYLKTDEPGRFDALMAQAVWMYQEAQGLTPTGELGPETLSVLFSPAAQPLPAGAFPATKETADSLPGPVMNLDWYEGGMEEIFPKESVGKYTDLLTGITWTEIRKGGYNHADTQPLTAEDTAAFLEAVGGKWTWDRRPVWVTIDGIRYAASINCMPHGAGSITDNNFNGHHCTHFLNSRTHATDTRDEKHQLCVSVAAATHVAPLPQTPQTLEWLLPKP